MTLRLRSRSPRWLTTAGLVLALLGPVAARAADDITVPPPLQVRLLSKILPYDREFTARAGERVAILLVARSQSLVSVRTQAQMMEALKELDQLGALPHTETPVTFTTSADLIRRMVELHAAVVYLMPGFSDADVVELAKAFTGHNVLTVSAAASDVDKGVVLSLGLASGKPQLQVNLGQARKQHVDFASNFLSLAKVIR